MVKKKLMFEEFKFKKRMNAMVSVRMSEADREFLRKKGISPTMVFNSKLKELKQRANKK